MGLLCVALLCVVAVSARKYDQGAFAIKSLPGWNGPLPTKQYSGLIDVGPAPSGVGNALMHFWFMESEGNPKTDPVLMWYNGGPGASSIYGLVVELGPLWLNDLSEVDHDYNISGIPQFVRNPYAWTKFASVLVVDSPPPVGFSYCTQYGPAANGTSCGAWNDTLTAQVNANFIIEWFKTFPQYKDNQFFITGESYAGVYVPIIARELLSRPEAKDIRLAGIATGDGCLGVDVLCGGPNLSLGAPWWDVVFFYGHGQVSNEFFDQLTTICTIAELKTPTQSPQCAAMVQKMYQVIGGFFEYNLYDYCPDNLFKKRKRSNPTYNFPGVGYPCGGSAMTTWINLPAVRRALNVPINSFFFNADNGNDFVYVPTEPNVMPFYKHLLDTRPDIRMLIYNGDADPSLSSFRTQAAWFPFMKQQQVSVAQEWRPWTLDNKTDVRGYVQEWTQGRFAFLTIRGSGHMVPEFRSQAAFAFMQTWIQGKSDYPTYNPPAGSSLRFRN